ncbi:MAG: hypothetical protein HYV39_02590 [Candidatus Levybacteria bacterium]|nr:hypothetical protein [Candidatus Levybacteria bacterium]
MKKVLSIFIFSIIFFFAAQLVFAQEKMATDEALLSKTPTPIDYQLPYPGLLPDSPLYFLKIFRDRLIDFLVADPLKKAELSLLQADKRLSSGQALFAKGKKELAESTISKGENYFEQGILKLKEAKKQGMDTKGLLEKFALSVKKHQEIVADLIKQASGDVKKRLENLDKRILEFEKQVSLLSPK